jgi:hypothetical protein
MKRKGRKVGEEEEGGDEEYKDIIDIDTLEDGDEKTNTDYDTTTLISSNIKGLHEKSFHTNISTM